MRKYSILLAIAFIAGLFLLQHKAVIPLVIGALDSDVFVGDPAQGGSAFAVENDKTTMAYVHCNDFVASRLPGAKGADFTGHRYKAWDIGFGRYLVNSYFLLTNEAGIQEEKAYVCKVKYLGGDENVHSNWELMGLDYA